MTIGVGITIDKQQRAGGVPYTAQAQALFDAYVADAGEQLPDAYKTIYNNLYKNLLGTGSKGSNNCLDAYKVLKACAGYSNGTNRFLLLCDLLNPSDVQLVQLNGGGNFVNDVGTDANCYARQSVVLKAWNSKVKPSGISGISQNDAFYATWMLVNTAGSASGLYALGCADGSSEVSMQRALSGTTSAFAVHDGTYIIKAFGGANNKGYMEMPRLNATTTRAYKNENQIGTDGTANSVSVPTKDIILFGLSSNDGGSFTQTGSGQKALVGLTGGIRSQLTTGVRQQFIDSLEQFAVDMGISSPKS